MLCISGETYRIVNNKNTNNYCLQNSNSCTPACQSTIQPYPYRKFLYYRSAQFQLKSIYTPVCLDFHQNKQNKQSVDGLPDAQIALRGAGIAAELRNQIRNGNLLFCPSTASFPAVIRRAVLPAWRWLQRPTCDRQNVSHSDDHNREPACRGV